MLSKSKGVRCGLGAASVLALALTTLQMACTENNQGGNCPSSECDDGNECTEDICSLDLDGNPTCRHELEDGVDCGECTQNADCDNGLFCDGAETCVFAFCEAGLPPCEGGACSETIDDCFSSCEDDSECDDGDACSGVEMCLEFEEGIGEGRTCVEGAVPDCDDGDPCTVDACDSDATDDPCSNMPIECPSASICDEGECRLLGFHELDGLFDVFGDCDDDDRIASLESDEDGNVSLVGFGTNGPIALEVNGTVATASGVEQFKEGGHDIRLEIIDVNTVSLLVDQPMTGGECDAVLTRIQGP